MQDVLKRVGSPVSLAAPRAARGVERRVISRGPSHGRSGCSQRLCHSEGGGDRRSDRGRGCVAAGMTKVPRLAVAGGCCAAGTTKVAGLTEAGGC